MSTTYLNRFRHENCPVQPGIEWDDTWSCACNDHCPACDAEIEPYEFEEVVCEAPAERVQTELSAYVWRKGPPPHVGWWNASLIRDARQSWRWWDGECWSASAAPYNTAEEAGRFAAWPGGRQDAIEWTLYWPEGARVPRAQPGQVAGLPHVHQLDRRNEMNWDTSPEAKAAATARVDHVIVEVILPQAYQAIDDLLDVAGPAVPKELLIRCKKLLPAQYRNSFEQKKLASKGKP